MQETEIALVSAYCFISGLMEARRSMCPNVTLTTWALVPRSAMTLRRQWLGKEHLAVLLRPCLSSYPRDMHRRPSEANFACREGNEALQRVKNRAVAWDRLLRIVVPVELEIQQR